MEKLTAKEINDKFLKFFESQGHLIIPSHSLIPPQDDKSGLLVNSGMHPLKKLFTGEEEPKAKRLVNVQKCVRTGDIENIGDTYHHTFFFMMGNWSIGDYFKKEAIQFAWDFLVGELGFEPEKLFVTYFKSDMEGVPDDEESKNEWLKRLPENHVIGLGQEDNFWKAGPTGPCGPCTEMYYDLGETEGWCGKCDGPGCENCGRFLEVWNCGVFMQYDRQENGELLELPFKSVDAGAGLERIASVMQGAKNNYESDLFKPLLEKCEELTGKKMEQHLKSFRKVADHSRAVCFLIADGVRPGNVDRDYVLRRLLRGLVREGMRLEAPANFLGGMCEAVFQKYGEWWPELLEKKAEILQVVKEEEEGFKKALEKGLKKMEQMKQVDPETAFDLFQTFGLPLEIINEELGKAEKGEISEEDFEKAFAQHQEVSKKGMTERFKGGVAESGDEEKKKQLHTTAHLMLAAMKKVLGDQVEQKGSNITEERLRFDFNHPEKVEREFLDQIEDLVNEQIQKDVPVSFAEMSLKDAKEKGAHGTFEDKYGDKVKVFTIGEPGEHFSMEICGGPHVKKTGEIKGKFKIKKESSSSKGIRRVKAVLE